MTFSNPSFSIIELGNYFYYYVLFMFALCYFRNGTPSWSDQHSFEFNMPALTLHLRRLHEQTPNARYYNVDVMKYQIKTLAGAKSAPLQLVSYWRCGSNATCLKIDYKYNASALTKLEPLRNVTISANVEGEVINMQAQPNATW